MSEDLRRDSGGQAVRQRGEFQLQLLGDFSLRRGQERIRLPMGPQRLLAFLAIKGPAPRPIIMGTLWPEVSEPHARGSLRTTMWRLHHNMPCLVLPAGDALGLHPNVLVDIQAATESARVIMKDASHLTADLALLHAQGELLPGWYDDWVIFERERLRQLRLHVLDSLAERLASRRQFMRALEAAMTSAGIEPLRESAHRAIIAIHLAEQNLVEALRDYELFRNLLRAELGVEPSRQLTAMLPLTTMKTDR